MRYRVPAPVRVAFAAFSLTCGAIVPASASADAEVVSVNSVGLQANKPSTNPSISHDGNFIVFESSATNLVSGDRNHRQDVFVRDRRGSDTTRISIGSGGEEGDQESRAGAISSDGHFVVFESDARNLVSGDRNKKRDVFIRDLIAGTTWRVSVSSDRAEANGDSRSPSVSSDGRFVAFSSRADNLVPGDTNHKEDVFVHDVTEGTTRRVSLTLNGEQSNRRSLRPVISADGQYVAFETRGDLDGGDLNPGWDIYVADLETGFVERASADLELLGERLASRHAAVSADGRYIAFEVKVKTTFGDDDSQEAIEEDLPPKRIVVRDMELHESIFVSDDATFNGQTLARPSLSADGRYLVFQSRPLDEPCDDEDEAPWQVWALDVLTRKTAVVSAISSGEAGTKSSKQPVISGDGRFIAFSSKDRALSEGDETRTRDILLVPNPLLVGTIATVTAQEGGSLEVTDPLSPVFGARVEVPPDAVLEDTDFSILEAPAEALAAGEDFVAVGPTVEFGPAGTLFDQPVRVFVPFYSGFENPLALQVVVQEEISGPFTVLDPIDVDLGNSRLVVEVGGFSFFTVACLGSQTICTPLRNVARISQGSFDFLNQSIRASNKPSMSINGRYVAFQSSNENWIPLNGNARLIEIFVRDRDCDISSLIPPLSYCQDGDNANSNGILDEPFQSRTRRACVGTDGYANGHCENPSISGDGRYVAYESTASNLVNGEDHPSLRDVFVRDMTLNQTILVSKSVFSGQKANSHSRNPSISADGRYVAFESAATNLVGGQALWPIGWRIYVRDLVTNTTRLASFRYDPFSQPQYPTGASYRPSISPDGSYVAFESTATNLVPGDTNGRQDIFLAQMNSFGIGSAIRISVAGNGQQANGHSYRPSVSEFGRLVTFDTYATNLVSGDTNGRHDVFAWTSNAPNLELVSRKTDRIEGNGHSLNAKVSANGQFVVFESDATNFISNAQPDVLDRNNRRDIYVAVRPEGVVNRVSDASILGVQGNNTSWNAAISADGTSIAFESASTNLVAGDTNRTWDVFATPNPFLKPRIAVTQFPNTTEIAGELWQPIVAEIRDPAGHRLNVTDCVVAEVVGGTGELQGDIVACPENGIITFDNLSYLIAEPVSIQLKSLFLVSSELIDVTVVANAAASLVLTSAPDEVQTAGVLWNGTAAVRVADDFGNTVASDNTTEVKIKAVQGSGAFTSTSTTTVRTVAGVAAFNDVAYSAAELIELGFEDSQGILDATNAGGAFVSVIPGPPASISLVASPQTPQIAGQKWAPPAVVRVYDGFGNFIFDDNTTEITITNLISLAPMPSESVTTVAVNQGVATFDSLEYRIAETISFDFVDTADLLDNALAQNVSVEVVPSVPSRLEFDATPPAMAAIGSVWPAFTVRVVDEFGNTVVGDNATQAVVSVIQGSQAFEPGSVATATASGGVIVFDRLVYGKAETIRIRVQDTANALDVSAVGDTAIAVVPQGVPTQLALTTPQPLAVREGYEWPVLELELQDGTGQAIDAFGGITLTLAGASGELSGSTQARFNSGTARFEGLRYRRGEALPATFALSFSTDVSGVPALTNIPITVEPAIRIDSVHAECDASLQVAVAVIQGHGFAGLAGDFSTTKLVSRNLDPLGDPVVLNLNALPPGFEPTDAQIRIPVANPDPLTAVLAVIDGRSALYSNTVQAAFAGNAAVCGGSSPIIERAEYACSGPGQMTQSFGGASLDNLAGDFTGATLTEVFLNPPGLPDQVIDLENPPASVTVNAAKIEGVPFGISGMTAKAAVTVSNDRGTSPVAGIFAPNPNRFCPATGEQKPEITSVGFSCDATGLADELPPGAVVVEIEGDHFSGKNLLGIIEQDTGNVAPIWGDFGVEGAKVSATGIRAIVDNLNYDVRSRVRIATDIGTSEPFEVYWPKQNSLCPPPAGLFNVGDTYSIPGVGNGLARGDFNSDRIVDLVIVSASPGPLIRYSEVHVFLGNGSTGIPNGELTLSTVLPVNLSNLATPLIGDFNNDGIQDIASAGVDPATYLVVWMGNGDGTFIQPPIFTSHPRFPGFLASDDINGDGILDLVVGNASPVLTNDPVYVYWGVESSPGSGQGTGAFVPSPFQPGLFSGTFPGFVLTDQFNPDLRSVNKVPLDLNNDGLTDLIVANADDDTVTVYHKMAGGTYTLSAYYPVARNPKFAVAADFNNDGIPDIAVISLWSDLTITTLFGCGAVPGPGGGCLNGVQDGRFALGPQTSIPSIIPGHPGVTTPIASTGDFNLDGVLDLAISRPFENPVSIFLGHKDGAGNPDGEFVYIEDYLLLENTVSVVTGEFNGDNRPDLAVAGLGSMKLLNLVGNEPPTISGSPPDSVYEGDLYSFAPTATDADSVGAITFEIANQPLWAAFDTVTGTLEGMPTNADVGIYSNIVITARDGAGAPSSLPPFSIEVIDVNTPPQLVGIFVDPPTAAAIFEGQPLYVEFYFEDPDSLYRPVFLTFTFTDLPPWLSFAQTSPTSVAIFGTPGNDDVGPFPGFSLLAEDLEGGTAAFASGPVDVVNANNLPAFGPIPTLIAQEDALFSYLLPWSDPDIQNVAESVTFDDHGTLPSWLTLTTNGELVGRPTNDDVGSYGGVLITATDGAGATATTNPFAVVVQNTNDAPTIGGVPPPTAVVSVEYLFVASVEDDDLLHGDQLIYLLTGPGWLHVDAFNGRLFGTPSIADIGLHENIQLQVRDLADEIAVLGPFSIEVLPNVPPTITELYLPPAVAAGRPYFGRLDLFDPDSGSSLSVSILNGPAWLISSQVSDHNWEFIGVPAENNVGTFSGITLVIDDGGGNVLNETFQITVLSGAPDFAGFPASNPPQPTQTIAAPQLFPQSPNPFLQPPIEQDPDRRGGL